LCWQWSHEHMQMLLYIQETSLHLSMILSITSTILIQHEVCYWTVKICSFSRSTTDTNCLQRFHWSSKPLWIAWQGQKNQSKHQSFSSCREQSFCTNLAEVLKDRVLAKNDIEWQFYIVFSPIVILLNRNFAIFPSSGVHIWELYLLMTNWTSHFCAQILPISLSSHSKFCIQSSSLKCLTCNVYLVVMLNFFLFISYAESIAQGATQRSWIKRLLPSCLPCWLPFTTTPNTEVNWEQS
jgi:hypothetical protein